MKQEVLKYFTDTHWTGVALGLFLFAFGMIAIWTFFVIRRAQIERWSRLPLDD